MVKPCSKLKPIGVRFTEQQQTALAEIGSDKQLSFGNLVRIAVDRYIAEMESPPIAS